MKRTKSRSQRGSLVIELGCSCFALAIFAIISVHVSLLIFGAFINDRACHDAARAAAQGQSQTEALKLATTILQTHNPSGSYVAAPTIKGNVVYQDYNGSPPSGQSPYVQVTTQTKVQMPCSLLQVCGETFKDGNITFVQSYTFPVVRIK